MIPAARELGRHGRFPQALTRRRGEPGTGAQLPSRPGLTRLRVWSETTHAFLQLFRVLCSEMFASTKPRNEEEGKDMPYQPVANPAATQRHELPGRRESVTQKFTIIDHRGRHTMHFTVGFYPDSGAVAEIFASLKKTGSKERAFLDSMARATSLGLQHGVPLESFVEMFVGTQGTPGGTVAGHPNIKRCQGPIDLLFRWLGFEFCGIKELGHVQDPVVEESPKD